MGYVTSLKIVRPFSPLAFTNWLKSKLDDSKWFAEKYMGREDLEEIIGHVPDMCQRILDKVVDLDDCGNLMYCMNLFEEWLVENGYAEQIFFKEVYRDESLWLVDFAPDPMSCLLDSLSDEKRLEHDEWVETHIQDGRYSGAIGGRISYILTDTSLGVMISVQDVITGDTLLLNDPDGD